VCYPPATSAIRYSQSLPHSRFLQFLLVPGGGVFDATVVFPLNWSASPSKALLERHNVSLRSKKEKNNKMPTFYSLRLVGEGAGPSSPIQHILDPVTHIVLFCSKSELPVNKLLDSSQTQSTPSSPIAISLVLWYQRRCCRQGDQSPLPKL
jgi:hypothetical protein